MPEIALLSCLEMEDGELGLVGSFWCEFFAHGILICIEVCILDCRVEDLVLETTSLVITGLLLANPT